MENAILLFLDLDLGSGGNFIAQLVVNGLALLIASWFLEGVQVKGLLSPFLVALVLAILNATIGMYLTEITGFYKGILHFLVDAALIMMASFIMEGFKVKGPLWAIVLAVVLAFLNTFLYQFLF